MATVVVNDGRAAAPAKESLAAAAAGEIGDAAANFARRPAAGSPFSAAP